MMRLTSRHLAGFFAVALVVVMNSNALLTLFALAVLVFGFVLLGRMKVSPILLFVFGYQWLQVSTKLIQANLLGVDLDGLSQFGGQLSSALFLSLVGLVSLAMGMRWGAGPEHARDSVDLLEDSLVKPPLFWLKLYFAAFLLAIVAHLAARKAPGFSQPLLAIVNLKWAFYWILTYVTFIRVDGLRGLWLVVFIGELALGFGGYFSDFRTVLIMTILALVPAGLKRNAAQIVGLTGIALLTLVLGIVWTAIKPEYRDFLSQGERAQVVSVTYAESLAHTATLISALDSVSLQIAINNLVARISYVDFFAQVVDFVPKIKPHENGAIWGDALLRPFMPRLLFPQKSVINDSDRTNEFTALSVATADEGASIGVGYMAETYIDFGPFFMMAPIFLLGWGVGKFYKWITNYPKTQGLLGMGLATATLYPAAQFETSITKLIGGLFLTMLICWIFAPWIALRFLSPERKNWRQATGRRG